MSKEKRKALKQALKGKSFLAETKELYHLLQEKVRAGRGRRALIEAVAEQTLRDNKVQAEPKNQPAAPTSKASGVAALKEMADQAPGGQLHISAEEYRRIMGLDP